MPQAYFTFAKQIFHIEDISLVPQGTNFIEKGDCRSNRLFLVPVAGVEPARCCHQRILSPSRLPIPSHRLAQI